MAKPMGHFRDTPHQRGVESTERSTLSSVDGTTAARPETAPGSRLEHGRVRKVLMQTNIKLLKSWQRPLSAATLGLLALGAVACKGWSDPPTGVNNGGNGGNGGNNSMG